MNLSTRIRVNQAREGDMADHRSGTLDPRRVAKIERIDGKWMAWLHLITATPSGPFRAANYTFHRTEKSE